MTGKPEGHASTVVQARTGSATRLAMLLTIMVSAYLLAVTSAAPARAAEGASAPALGAEAADGATEPLSAADRDLLAKVRQAGLWEGPAGQMATAKGAKPRVREVGALLKDQHAQLDALVIRAAKQVGVELPTQPSADQLAWLEEMSAASGTRFDQVFVDRLRAAHGKVFPVIANVRSGTKNTVVRQLAQSANNFVLTHLTLLESTDLVDYSTLPSPPQPAAVAAATGVTRSNAAPNPTAFLGAPASLTGIVLPVALLVAVPFLLRWLVRRRLDQRRSQRYDSERYDSQRYDSQRYGRAPAYERYEQRDIPPFQPSSPYAGTPPGPRSRRLQPAPRLRH